MPKKNYAVFVIEPNGTVTKTVQAKKPEYEQLREAVEGLIETVPYFTKFEYPLGTVYKRGTCYANEEGLLLGKPYNAIVSGQWKAQFPHGATQIVGRCIFYATTDEPVTV